MRVEYRLAVIKQRIRVATTNKINKIEEGCVRALLKEIRLRDGSECISNTLSIRRSTFGRATRLAAGKK